MGWKALAVFGFGAGAVLMWAAWDAGVRAALGFVDTVTGALR